MAEKFKTSGTIKSPRAKNALHSHCFERILMNHLSKIFPNRRKINPLSQQEAIEDLCQFLSKNDCKLLPSVLRKILDTYIGEFESVYINKSSTSNVRTDIGIIVTLMKDTCREGLQVILNIVMNRLRICTSANVNDEYTTSCQIEFYISILENLLRDSSLSEKYRKYQSNAVKYMLRSIVEIFDSLSPARVLSSFIKLLKVVYNHYNAEFHEDSEEIVDILVGWYLDPSLSTDILVEITSLFKIIHLFWLKNPLFTEEVISKLIADTYDLLKNDETSDPTRGYEISSYQPATSAHLSSYFSFLNCIQTIIYSMTFGLYYKLSNDNFPREENESLSRLHNRLCRDSLEVTYAVSLATLNLGIIKKGISFAISLARFMKLDFFEFQETAISIVGLDILRILIKNNYYFPSKEKHPGSPLYKAMTNFLDSANQIREFCPKLHINLLLYFSCSITHPSGGEIRCLFLETPSLENKFLSYFYKILHTLSDIGQKCNLINCIYLDIKTAFINYASNSRASGANDTFVLSGHKIDENSTKFERNIEDCLLKYWSSNGKYESRLSRTVQYSDTEYIIRALNDNTNLLCSISHRMAIINNQSPSFLLNILYGALSVLGYPPPLYWDDYEELSTCITLNAFSQSRRLSFIFPEPRTPSEQLDTEYVCIQLRIIQECFKIPYDKKYIAIIWLGLICEKVTKIPTPSLILRSSVRELISTCLISSLSATDYYASPHKRIHYTTSISSIIDYLRCVEKIAGSLDPKERSVMTGITEICLKEHKASFIDISKRYIPIIEKIKVSDWAMLINNKENTRMHRDCKNALPDFNTDYSPSLSSCHLNMFIDILKSVASIWSICPEKRIGIIRKFDEFIIVAERLCVTSGCYENAHKLEINAIFSFIAREAALMAVNNKMRVSSRDHIELAGVLESTIISLILGCRWTTNGCDTEVEYVSRIYILLLSAFIEFMDSIEKLIISSIEGPTCHRNISSKIQYFYYYEKDFFYDYFMKIRRYMIIGANMAGLSEIALRNCIELLNHSKGAATIGNNNKNVDYYSTNMGVFDTFLVIASIFGRENDYSVKEVSDRFFKDLRMYLRTKSSTYKNVEFEYLKNTVVFNIVERSLEGKRDYLYDFLWLLATKYNKYSDYEPMGALTLLSDTTDEINNDTSHVCSQFLTKFIMNFHYPLVDILDFDFGMSESERNTMEFRDILAKAHVAISYWPEVSQSYNIDKSYYGIFLEECEKKFTDPMDTFYSSRPPVFNALLKDDYFNQIVVIFKALCNHEGCGSIIKPDSIISDKSKLIKLGAYQIYTDKSKIFKIFLQYEMMERIKSITLDNLSRKSLSIREDIYDIISLGEILHDADILKCAYRELNVIHLLEKNNNNTDKEVIKDILKAKFSICSSIFRISKDARNTAYTSLAYKIMSYLNQLLGIKELSDLYDIHTYEYLGYLIEKGPKDEVWASEILKHSEYFQTRASPSSSAHPPMKMELLRLLHNLLSDAKRNKTLESAFVGEAVLEGLFSVLGYSSRSSEVFYNSGSDGILLTGEQNPKFRPLDVEVHVGDLFDTHKHEAKYYSSITITYGLFLYNLVIDFIEKGAQRILDIIENDNSFITCPFSALLATIFSDCKNCKHQNNQIQDKKEVIYRAINTLLDLKPNSPMEETDTLIANFLMKEIFYNCEKDCRSILLACDTMKIVRKELSERAVKSAELIIMYLSLDSNEINSHGVKKCMLPYALLRLISLNDSFIPPKFIDKIKEIPIRIWAPLFSQIIFFVDHPSETMKTIAGVLMVRIAETCPNTTLYKIASSIDANNIKDIQGSSVTSFYKTLKHHMANKGYGPLLCQTSSFLEELRSVALTPGEVYLCVINNIKNNIHSILDILKTHFAAEIKDADALSQYYHLVMDPILNHLERFLKEITPKENSSLHQRKFHDKYNAKIRSYIDALKTPAQGEQYKTVKMVWSRLMQTADIIESELGKVLVNDEQGLESYSHFLRDLYNSPVPIPSSGNVGTGLELDGDIVTVSKICPVIDRYHSKAMPKKIAIIGSDGRRYSYLLKGLEDLYQDEIAHCFLKLSNIALEREKVMGITLTTRSYDVIALGKRLGIARWVEDTCSLHSIYSEWRKHIYVIDNFHELSETVKNSSKVHCSTFAGYPRNQIPMNKEFYNISQEALRLHNVNPRTPRHMWPIGVCIDIYKKMVSITPNFIIKNYLWLNSADCNTWWNKCRAFSNSVGVASIVGYVIGLGDRHLGNILLDKVTGEVVHVDYNVCFNYGKNLLIPETVPFRLTQNIEAALCINQIRGPFWDASRKTFEVLRANSMYFHSFLDVISCSPNVNWSKFTPKAREEKLASRNLYPDFLAMSLKHVRGLLIPLEELIALSEEHRIYIHNLISSETAKGAVVEECVSKVTSNAHKLFKLEKIIDSHRTRLKDAIQGHTKHQSRAPDTYHLRLLEQNVVHIIDEILKAFACASEITGIIRSLNIHTLEQDISSRNKLIKCVENLEKTYRKLVNLLYSLLDKFKTYKESLPYITQSQIGTDSLLTSVVGYDHTAYDELRGVIKHFKGIRSFTEVEAQKLSDEIDIHDNHSSKEEQKFKSRLYTSQRVLFSLKSIISGENEYQSIISVEEQLSAVIEQARKIEHIAPIYEGWMPWV